MKFILLIILIVSLLSCSEYHYDVNKKTIRHNCDYADNICEQAKELERQVNASLLDYEMTKENLDLINLKEKYRWLKEKCIIEQERCTKDDSILFRSSSD